MLRIKFIFSAVFLISLLILQANSYAAYVGDPCRIFTYEGKEKPYSVYTEGIIDVVYDRGAKHQTDDAKVDFYGGIAGLIYKNRYALYGGAGVAKVEATYTILNKEITWESDHGFTYLIGGTIKLYEKDFKNFYDSKLLISLDTQWRNTDIDADVITIDSVNYDIPHSAISYSSIEYNDWHMALACGLDFGMFSPYAGIKYSDFESSVRVMKGATLYQKDNAEADDNFGLFVGAGIKIVNSLYANIEAGFIDEDFISGSLSWKF